MKKLLAATFVALLMVGCGDSSTTSDSILSPTATDANDSFDAIDFEDNETLNRIIAEAIEDVVKFGDYHGSLPEAEIKKIARGGADMRGTTGFELYFAPNMQKPYTGWVKRFHKNGRLRSLDQYKDGKMHGRKASWSDDGELEDLIGNVWKNGNPVWD
jgi:hypothetical protein